MRLETACAVAAALVCTATATDWLEASRAAVAGDRPPIRALKMSGRVRMAGPGDEVIDGSVELRLQPPRRYLRIDTIGTTRRVAGFDGGRVLAVTKSAGGLAEARAELARLMLGIAAIVVGDEPVKVEPGGEEAFPDTRALDLAAKNWSLRFVMDAATSMPMRLVFFGRGRGTTITSFADRRDVGGYRLPHRITTTTSDRVLETLMIDDVEVNPSFSDADFAIKRR